MASIDEELRLDAEQDEREVAYIMQSLPNELKEAFTREDLYYMMDTIVEYYYESGVLESDSDEVDIDLQQVADYAASTDANPKKPVLLDTPTEFAYIDQDGNECHILSHFAG